MSLTSSAMRRVVAVTVSLTFFLCKDVDAAYATRYWDCCKAHCSWAGNVFGEVQPLGTCNKDDVKQNDPSITSACASPSYGAAFTCHDNIPWSVNSTHAYGFAAVPATGDVCGNCFELTFTGEGRYDTNAGATALGGKVMTVQATNIGYDVNNEQFDIMIPGGGVGAFDACTYQWGVSTDQLGAQYGGFLTSCQRQHGWNADHATYKSCVRAKCSEVFGGPNSQLSELYAGCIFFVDWFEVADNPSLTYRQVTCPSDLVAVSGMSRTPIIPTMITTILSTTTPSQAPSTTTLPQTTTSTPSVTPSSTTSSSSFLQPRTTTSTATATATTLAHNGGTCSNKGENCLSTQCCNDPSLTCYEKNQWWASCKPLCTPGSIDPTDQPQWQTPWTCTPLSGCSSSSQNCHGTQCCSDSSQTCYEKDQWWAQCKASCIPGIDPTEDPQWQTPWSCSVLSSIGSTTSTAAQPATTTLPAICTGVGADRWGSNLGSCCSGLVECQEPRPQSDPYYCAATDSRHGSSCWSSVTICRSECSAVQEPEPEPEPTCSATNENCLDTQCCSDSSLTCYEKNQWWAQCKASCTPGIHQNEAPQWQTPWSCMALGNR